MRHSGFVTTPDIVYTYY